ncbi:MAG: bifunctional DNA-formamidopyrimidine glycosylase/DNA-(apurinic or apyrimidinic site) lyase [Rubrivivax sp.]|jgi:formamidopyrimidine-DNA glycosylase|nr:bifunctional DNA-formamidopyrimidine glycosylase/DNA-(apurinic or apyrimidinic site) lyase [Rubrivivax sp.]
MPELPEVEVTRRSIDEPLRGARISAVRLGKPLRWPLGRDPQRLHGLCIGPVARRGKYLWLPLQGAPVADDDEHLPDQGLLLHLGMSGSLALHGPAPPAGGPHDHFELQTDRGTLRLTDPRRFGAVVWSASLSVDPAARLLAGLGAEPFDLQLTPARFHAHLQRRRAAVKAVLLAGDVIVGAGNIYACEALFQAGIDPRLSAARISRPRAGRLLAALRQTLARALDLGGSTLRDFHDAHGLSGAFQTQAAVYGREGEACGACGTPVRRIVQSQRSTYFCPRCQRR